jgi:hypothetical protein
MSAHRVYEASPIKLTRRATTAEMEERAAFLIDYAERHGPVTVRGLYYRAEVEGLPGIDKAENSYDKNQRQVSTIAPHWPAAVLNHRRSDAVDAQAHHLQQH